MKMIDLQTTMREVGYLEKITVTPENIEEIKDIISAIDQSETVEVGEVVSYYPITYQPGNQGGDITIWHKVNDNKRLNGALVCDNFAMLCLGAYSLWCDYDEDAVELIHPDEVDGINYHYDLGGELVRKTDYHTGEEIEIED